MQSRQPCDSGGFVFSRIFPFQLQDSNRVIKPRPHGRSLHAVTRGLHGAGDTLSSQEGVHAAGGLLPLGDRVDDFSAAVGAVAAGEHVLQVRLAGVGVAADDTARVELKGWEELSEEPHLFFLADSLDDHVERLDKFRARQNLHFSIRTRGAGQLQAGDVAGAVRQDFHWDDVKPEPHTLGSSQFLLELVSGHLCLGAAIDDDGFARAQAARLGNRIDGGVATADDRDAVADGHARARDVCGFAQ